MGSGFSNPVKSTDQITVLKAAMRTLIAGVPSFNDGNTFWTLSPEPLPYNRENLCCGVSPLDGDFSPDLLEGGGRETCEERSGIIISIWSRQVSDQQGHGDHVLFGTLDDNSRSLLRLKQEILKALVSVMLTDPDDGSPILTEYMFPIWTKAPRMENWDRNENTADMQLGFSTSFLWDLTDD